MISERRFYAVRCCCRPQKILGFVPLPAHLKSGQSWEMSSPDGRVLIRIENFYDTFATVEPAVYGDNRPLAYWRKVEGFIAIAEAADSNELPSTLGRARPTPSAEGRSRSHG